MSDLANIASSITFGDISDSFKQTADELQAKSKETWDSAEQDVLNWESSGAQAVTNAAKTSKERFAEIAADSEAAYRKMAENAEATAEQQEAALVKYALDNIKANDNVISDKLRVELAEKNLQAVIDETGQATVRAMTASDIAATEAAKKAEKLNAAYVLIAESLGIGLTSKYREVKASIIELSDSFDVLTDAGYQTGEVLFAALNDMTNKAKNTDELQDIILMWEDLGKQGQLTGEDLAAGLDLANERLDALTDGVNSVNEAYKVLGLTTRAEAAKQAEAYTQAYGIIVKDGEATAGQLADGFKKYAKAAVAANGDVVTAQLKTEAAQRGLTIAVDETGRVTFEKMGQSKVANDNVTRSVNNIRTAYDGISSSAGSAGNSMVRAANDASSAYDKLQQKIKSVKEAQELKNADETLRNLRQYGTEDAPIEGNQFGTRLGVENFLKSQGLSEAAAIEEARKLYAKKGASSGALNFGELQGFSDGQMMTSADLDKFKTASMYLAEIAEKARQNERQRDNYEAARTATAQITTQEYGRFDSQPRSTKTIDVNFKLGGASATMSMPENQEASLMALLQQLQDSKAIAGY
jgi:DNA-binding transcriptional regulator of glucitol operon